MSLDNTNNTSNGEAPSNDGISGAAQDAYDCSQRGFNGARTHHNHDVIVVDSHPVEAWSAIQAQGIVRPSEIIPRR